jgi:hypothetical protein
VSEWDILNIGIVLISAIIGFAMLGLWIGVMISCPYESLDKIIGEKGCYNGEKEC